MTDNIVPWGGITRHDIPADRVINAALEHGLEGVVIIGFDKDGAEYFASSYADGSDALWLIERGRHKLMRIVDELEGEQP